MRWVNRQSPQPDFGALAIGSWLLSITLPEIPPWGWLVLLLGFGWGKTVGQKWLAIAWVVLLAGALTQPVPLAIVWGMAGAALWGVAFWTGRSQAQPLVGRIPIWVLGLWVLLSGLPLAVWLGIGLLGMGSVIPSGWQMWVSERVLRLQITGLWNVQFTYEWPLAEFSRLARIAWQDGETHWLQLSGDRRDCTLPPFLADEETYQHLCHACGLAKHETEKDSLSLAGVLLPVGATLLAGLALVVVGSVGLVLVPGIPPLPRLLVAVGALLLGPTLAWETLAWIAPRVLRPLLQVCGPVEPWGLGAIATVVAAVGSPAPRTTVALALAAIVTIAGMGLLALSHRTAIVEGPDL
ncbi:MAG TPA: hypothetical protein DCQ32_06060 [Cyanobacteria bacterium UBA8156]|nr:hypothetical protein [Cyanobacteria bacterium UBA8156]